ncbi:MAG: 3-isopropylmalate dehydrogenase [Armatimonadota bacterium]|nr:3-isopropylmalate dehydrogenase [Armatimonadota bacterium]MDR7518966.1 3-isopropylmalate dehydrogenase [Armatimonadota bacterium]MDR7548563.1 3-isopropylmalate dehydrogenase [Armatimonadota bacterium]
MKARIVLLPGDGIGPEVTAEAVKVLRAVARLRGHTFTFEEAPFGGAAIRAGWPPLPDATLEACRRADAVLLGAVGGPEWDGLPPDRRPEAGLLALRRALRLFANLRPVRAFPALLDAAPLRTEVLAGTDLLIVRELTGGLYFGEPRGRAARDGRRAAIDTLTYAEDEIARVVRTAFRAAQRRRRHLTSVDKANVLHSSQLWREVVGEVAREFPDVTLDHMLVDAAAMHLVRRPTLFDVMVTENMFGDILSDEAAGLVGSLGFLPSASLGADGPSLYEPVHGTAPDIAGKGLANPIGAILSAALLLRYALGLADEAAAVEGAVDAAVASGARTADVAAGRPALSTAAFGDRVAALLS